MASRNGGNNNLYYNNSNLMTNIALICIHVGQIAVVAKGALHGIELYGIK